MNEVGSGIMPKVSVCIVTYNHAKYIRQAILSVVEQKTDFPFEVIVGDDASSDGTSAIIKEIVTLYPCVRAILQPLNVGGAHNYFAVNKAAQGEFVAYLDGDDYWLPGKLQKQVDFLVANPHYSAVGTRFYTLAQDGQLRKAQQHTLHVDHDNVLTSKDLPKLSSLMLRSTSRELMQSSPEQMGNDMMIYFDLALSGPIKILDDFLAVYRLGVGVSSDPSKRDFILNSFDKVFDYALFRGYDEETVLQKKGLIYFDYAMDALHLKQFTEFSRLCKLSERGYPLMTIRQRVVLALRENPRLARLFHGYCLPFWLRKPIASIRRGFKGA